VYSQNDEERTILKHFEGKPAGTFLDIGAFHPTKFSNTRALWERGFKGVYVEPSPSLHQAFLDAIDGEPKMQLIPDCIGDKAGEVEFFDSGDWAVSTTDPTWVEKWKNSGATFTPIKVRMITVPMLLEVSIHKTFDFISLDTENTVKTILPLLDLNALKTSLICLEWNNQNREFFDSTLTAQGFNEIVGARTSENLIYAKAQVD
jgi:FkbM family methyltransferase